MSKIATLTYRYKNISIWLREKKGRHLAPYVVAIQSDGKEAHIQIKNKKVSDNNGVAPAILKYIIKWITAYQDELLEAWELSKKGKAPRVPQVMPKNVSSTFSIRKIKEIKTNRNLIMLIRFEDNEIRVIDFESIIPENPAFAPLKKPSIFMQAEADYMSSGVHWEVIDIDMEAAALYDSSDPIDLSKIKLQIKRV